MQYINWIVRGLIGSLFIFSGLIKINDPVGTAIKLEEYFEVFSNDFAPIFHAFVPYALPLAVFLCVLEVALGVALWVGYKMRLTLTLLLALITFFTFLTFYSAYFNKVTDCGCFGDAIKLTPWQSFSKDVVLLVLISWLAVQWHQWDNTATRLQTSVVLSTMLLSFAVAYYAIEHLPFIDFRPYKIGNHIPTLMKPQEPCRYVYVMEKDGKQVSLREYPTDPSYKLVQMIAENEENCKPKILDYSVWDDKGNDMTAFTFQANKLIVVVRNVKKVPQQAFPLINQLIAQLPPSVEAIALTASSQADFEIFRHEVQLAIPYYFADGTVLKTIMRSDPGILLLKNGAVVGKWHYNDVPNVATVHSLLK
ncbi:MAG: DoxX family membrane protein [Cytophagales bacterium]|nr:DoxX family membrane protein [Bernardetiaceae bacterium]MDW8203503.1 DoxX family membrane protein [Cytophagales bacterium]